MPNGLFPLGAFFFFMSLPLLNRVYIEITNSCNLNCPFCCAHLRTPRLMSVDMFRMVASQAAEVANHIYLHVLGEPLMHPHLDQILSVAESLGLHVNITTNATFLRRQLPMLMRYPVRLVSVSVHDWSSNFSMSESESLMADVISCAEELSSKTYVSFRLWNMDDSYSDNDSEREFTLRMRHLLCEHFHKPYDEIKGLGSNRLSDNIFMQNDRRFSWPSDSNPVSMHKHCLGVKQQLAVLCDGTIVPCCIDANGSMPLGNVCDMTLREALMTDRARRIVDDFNDNKAVESTCQHCGFHRY